MAGVQAHTHHLGRHAMLEDQLRARGIHDSRVLHAMAHVPRELFVAAANLEDAYADRTLPIGHGQTLSEPYMIGLMLQALGLRSSDRVLEVGTGTGYCAAVLATIVHQVFTVERVPELAAQAEERLLTLGYHGVAVRCGDGSLGWPIYAPYEAIVVSAASPRIPHALVDQLVVGGRMVIPLARSDGQRLCRVCKLDDDRVSVIDLGASSFGPLLGAQGVRAAS